MSKSLIFKFCSLHSAALDNVPEELLETNWLASVKKYIGCPSHTCSTLRDAVIAKQVALLNWVLHKKSNHNRKKKLLINISFCQTSWLQLPVVFPSLCFGVFDAIDLFSAKGSAGRAVGKLGRALQWHLNRQWLCQSLQHFCRRWHA